MLNYSSYRRPAIDKSTMEPRGVVEIPTVQPMRSTKSCSRLSITNGCANAETQCNGCLSKDPLQNIVRLS